MDKPTLVRCVHACITTHKNFTNKQPICYFMSFHFDFICFGFGFCLFFFCLWLNHNFFHFRLVLLEIHRMLEKKDVSAASTPSYAHDVRRSH